MKKVLLGIVAAVLAAAPAFAQDAEKPKRKMPSSAKYFTSLKAAMKEAARYDAPIFVSVVGKGTFWESESKKVMKHKFFQELASKGFFVYTMSVELSKKEKSFDGRTPKPLFEKLSAEDQALLDVIWPPSSLRKLPRWSMVTPDAKALKINQVDMPGMPKYGYLGPYLQSLQSAAQAYGIDIEMSKALVKYIEFPPEKKKKKQ